MIYFAVVAKGRDESAFIKRARRNEERAIFCKCEFYHVSIVSNRVRHPLSYPKDLEEPNRIWRSVPLAALGLHDLIDGGIRPHHILHDNFLAPVRASVELHHHRHRCCFNFHAVSIAGRVGHWLSYPKDFCDFFSHVWRDGWHGDCWGNLARYLLCESV